MNNQSLQLNSPLISALAHLYVALHQVNLGDRSYTEVHAIPEIHKLMGTEGNVGEDFNNVIALLVADDYQSEMQLFCDLSTLDRRLSGKNYVSFDFIGKFTGWCRGYFLPLNYDENGKLSSVIFGIQNIDEEKRRELDYQTALINATKRAEEASRAKGHFLAQMSHEIRTPLNGMLGLGELLSKEPLHYNARKYVEDINISSRNLLDIVNDILDVSRLEADKIEIIPTTYHVADMVHELNVIISPQAQKKGLGFSVEISEDMPQYLRGDVSRIRQILLNLLTNAVKYTKEGFIILKLSISSAEDGYLLHAQVTDTGIGIKQEDFDKLFESYTRVDESKNKGIQGTGLGLPIVKKLLELMGSTLSLTSTYGEGSTFSFDLFQEPASTPSINLSAPKPAPEVLAPIPSDKRILAVDDNLINLTVLSGFLHKLGLSPDCVNSGFKCLERIKNVHYDLIFLDHMMPEMDGIDTLNAIKTDDTHQCTDTPIIMLTANALNGAEEHYLELGFNGFLSKPVDKDALEKTLRKWLL